MIWWWYFGRDHLPFKVPLPRAESWYIKCVLYNKCLFLSFISSVDAFRERCRTQCNAAGPLSKVHMEAKVSKQADEGSEVTQLASSPEQSEGSPLPAAGLPGPFASLAGRGPSSMDVKMGRHKWGREQGEVYELTGKRALKENGQTNASCLMEYFSETSTS